MTLKDFSNLGGCLASHSAPRCNSSSQTWRTRMRSKASKAPSALADWRSAAQCLVDASRKGPHDAPIRENTCGCGPLTTQPSVGPLIRLRGYDAGAGTWCATVLYGNTGGGDGKPSHADDAEAAGLVEFGLEGDGGAAPAAADGGSPAVAAAAALLAGGHQPPLLHYRIIPAGSSGADGSGGGGGPSGAAVSAAPTITLQPLPLAAFGRQVFWRFDLTVSVLDTEAQYVEYWVDDAALTTSEPMPTPTPTSGSADDGDGGAAPSWARTPRQVYVPSRGEGWRWAFYSCAGFSLDVPAREQVDRFLGSFPLWSDLMSRHSERPFSALVGGGDQLYNDDVWQVPALEAWLALPNPEQRLAVPFTTDMKTQALSYYVRHYCTHYMSEPVREAYASIPQVNTWDDHDIFDGWGSYPFELQSCPVFTGMLHCARLVYLLFQQHTTIRRAAADGLVVTPRGGVHNVVVLGPHQALVLPDQRGERTRFQVLPLESYADVFAALVRLPRSVRYITLVTTVPVVYPHIIGSHSLMVCFRGLYRSSFFRPLMTKTGVSSVIMNRFGEPDLLDDLRDHWVAPGHLGERRFLMEHLQMLAKSRNCRVSIISGDVHLCGVGQLHSWPRSLWTKPQSDWRYMQQIISSAIVNKPPPTGLVRLLQWSGRAGMLNRRTRSRLQSTFQDVRTRQELLNQRNWCEVEVDQQSGELLFTLRVERDPPTHGAARNGGGGGSSDAPEQQLPRRALDCWFRCCGFGPTSGGDQQHGEAGREAGTASGSGGGGGGLGVRAYTVRVPALTVARPPLGSMEHELAFGKDF